MIRCHLTCMLTVLIILLFTTTQQGTWIDEIEERYAYEYWKLEDYERLVLLGREWHILNQLYISYGSENI